MCRSRGLTTNLPTYMNTLSNSRIVDFFSLPSPSMAEHNPVAYCAAMASAPAGAGTCSHCGTGILHHVVIEDASGVRWFIGSDCATKVGFDRRQVSDRLTHAQLEERQRRVDATDWSVFQSGKYAGRAVADVFLDDQDYVVWYCGQSNQTAVVCRAVCADLFARRQADADSRRAVLVNVFGEGFLSHHAGADGFLGGVCSDILAGRLPAPRALYILMEISAKASGRKGSKTYNAELERLESALSSILTD